MSPPVVFFDLGRTLGRTTLSADHTVATSFEAYPRTVELLPRLADTARLGVIATGDYWSEARARELLATTVAPYLETALILYLPSLSRDELQDAANRAGVQLSECLYVSQNGSHRWRAVQAGMRGVPHPALVEQELRGETLRYIRVDGIAAKSVLSWTTPNPVLGVVPLEVTQENGKAVLYAISSASGDAALTASGIAVESVAPGADVATTDLFLLRPGPATPEELQEYGARLHEAGLQPQSSDRGIIVSLPVDQSIDDFHPPRGLHGHTLAMLPSRTAINANGPLPPFAITELTAAEKDTLITTLTPALIRSHLDRFCGLAPLEPWPLTTPQVMPPPDRRIVSRFHAHPHNRVAAQSIQAALAGILGAEAVRPVAIERGAYRGLVNIEGELRGSELPDEIVIVGAHLDSTAANHLPYTPDVDPAPGADDDGSGIAAVLAIATVAKALCTLRRPKRTIHFVLFNAEEMGMVGSYWYATHCKNVEQQAGRRIVAMLQLDMIGYVRSDYPRIPGEKFELHTPSRSDLPTTDPLVIQRCAELARIVAGGVALAPNLHQHPQLYPLPGCDHDPAFDCSDHYRFAVQGWPACLIAEDMWMEACNLPGPTPMYPHPGYHTPNDRMVNYQYAADITRVVAGAVWQLANG
jgi:hypothetical protein